MDHTDCKQPENCINCKQNRAVDSKECEIWKKEKRILEVKHTKNISYPKVRKLVENSIIPTTNANPRKTQAKTKE